MSDEIVLYYNPFSRGRIAHWMLEETGASYRIELLDFETREHKSAEFLAINPMGKIPTIVHRGTVVTEAAAICVYLADLFPAQRLAPAFEDPARGTYLRWLFFGASCLEAALVDRMFSRSVPERARMMAYGSYEDTVRVLESALTPGPFLLGERFSAADVFMSSSIGWGMAGKSLEARPVFERYVQRTGERPAFQRAMAKREVFAKQILAKHARK